nr:hypothetical protein [uncultured Faecalimonas sp.]
MSKHRAYAVQIRKRRALKRKGIVSFLAIFAAIYITTACSILFTNAHGNAAEEPVIGKYYKSIQIQEQDTLRSIAKTYAKNSDKKTIAAYIREVKELNGIWMNELSAGDYLLIIYYDSVPES